MSNDYNKEHMDKDNCRDVDKGPNPYVTNIWKMAVQNKNYRTTIWTGCNLQMTLMSIPVNEDIGAEVHKDNDQFIRVEQGNALVKMKRREDKCEYVEKLCQGDGVFVPAGTKHNIINIGREPLKLTSVYAPPHHKRGTIHRTKKDAEKEEY